MGTISIKELCDVEVNIEPCRVCGSANLKSFSYSKEMSPAGRFWDNDNFQDATYEDRYGIKCIDCGYVYDNCHSYKSCVYSWNKLEAFSEIDAIEFKGELKEFALKILDDNSKLKEELIRLKLATMEGIKIGE